MLMKTATKAVRQKKVAQVDVSREVTRKGSTMTQMTVGRMAFQKNCIFSSLANVSTFMLRQLVCHCRSNSLIAK